MGFSLFGIPLGNASNIAAALSLLTILGLVWRTFIAGAPARALAKNEADASLRSTLMDRITKLEETQVSDRDKHAEERRRDREECDARNHELEERIRKQNETIDGLQRQLIMFQVASARAMPLTANSPEIDHMIECLGPLFAVPSPVKSDTLKAAEETRHAAEVTVENIHQDEASR